MRIMLCKPCFDPGHAIGAGIEFSFETLEDWPVLVSVKINHLCGYTKRIFELLIANSHEEATLLCSKP